MLFYIDELYGKTVINEPKSCPIKAQKGYSYSILENLFILRTLFPLYNLLPLLPFTLDSLLLSVTPPPRTFVGQMSSSKPLPREW